ncbi:MULTISPECIES: phosphoribosylformylglycinamidine synthase [Petrimonas]|jgi:phosphoribosylformylglycinamidine synthase|uniref:Phosphoribosylformylglycinamidine synthase n=1 Tax=Petrimonas mucosa TaxID=1642646 RepID=A0A1G4G9P6_9BACT|nr:MULTISPECIES: phosphoribosylformylglycinamidine synthase [Petrimonas]MDD3559951.1 phosphoribosylformylglycinamidine synthase [Petrimonas mucosa]SCM59274.1 putative phosphoribosylformylglycinamidine synthase, chloroplastic/mitochondrial [Petrimonas mucosa]HHT29289.1 phosphoribosylformylglycinamidine synthase [Petrimonas mucosa]
MITFFKTPSQSIIAVDAQCPIQDEHQNRLVWLFGNATPIAHPQLDGKFIGPRREMITPWSTCAVEIVQNMGIDYIVRVEEYFPAGEVPEYDPMLQRVYSGLDQHIFTVDKQPEPIVLIDDIGEYNQKEGLALSEDEIEYLNNVSRKLGRRLTDSEVFGFSQVNSEHCRHKIFNGKFVIDGEEMESSLFQLIKRTSEMNPNALISAYKDNVAFVQGPTIEQFAPASGDKPDFFETREIESVLSLKAETHNFPTTVEPFNGASTGTGGEIRDRLAGGRASLPLAGTAVYMTSYPRLEEGRDWEKVLPERRWLYQTPEQILIKASNGASDFGNKYGQPLICGSVLTFEHAENYRKFGYDKVIMLAGGVGFANKINAIKGHPQPGEKVIVMGGDNYRIGMGGGAVSSVNTGEYSSGIELNAVQRANPEMQKRVANVIRTLAESEENPIVSIHDHGAGGHLNCLSELVEKTGGRIDMDKLPIGDPTLSAKEIIGNESQERMGLLVPENDIERIRQIAERERAPFYVVGETTDDMKLTFRQADGQMPIDMELEDFFGKSPKTVMSDVTVEEGFSSPEYDENKLETYLENVLKLEAVACKDWLTNKVDRSVTGKVARQQCQGEIQLPLSDCGAVALDYRGYSGVATSIGHAPQVALIDPAAGSVAAIAEALTNIVFAPLKEGLQSVSLSANWMWPCRNEGEDARLYRAVEACSDFACELGINIPTGKDSLSMTQKYGDDKVLSPGTVIISAAAEVKNVRKIVSPVLAYIKGTYLYYIDFSFDTLRLGGSALLQTLGRIGDEAPTVSDVEYFKNAFAAVQELVNRGLIIAGHDISAGGMITAMLEMCFANPQGGLEARLDKIRHSDLIKILFAENPGVLIQVKHHHLVEKILNDYGVGFAIVARPIEDRKLIVEKGDFRKEFDIDALRDVWYRTSYLLDRKQSGETLAGERFKNYKQQPLQFNFLPTFTGKMRDLGLDPDRKERSGLTAAIIRDKGTNGEREMAYALYLAGFDVKDVHMTDLISGRETLEEVQFAVFCGGFSNSDVLGSSKGWAGGILYNEKARRAVENFYARPDTLSLGVCNGCQLLMELGLIYPELGENHPRMHHNRSHKFESAFVSVEIPDNRSVMLRSLAGTKLGIWVAHGEGRFSLPGEVSEYNIAAKYVYDGYPGNPNGSDHNAAAVCSADGRHLAMMPHLERTIFPWQNAWYPYEFRKHDVTPWMEAFVNAREWIKQHQD